MNSTSLRLAARATFFVLTLGLAVSACSSPLKGIGEDCTADTECESNLCDNNGSCAAPVQTLDGMPCKGDKDCPQGNSCDTTSGFCFSPISDGKPGVTFCTIDADCPSGTCGKNNVCK